MFKNYNSVENKSKRLLRDDITNWFYKYRSMTRDSPDKLKNDLDRKLAISQRKIKDKLSDDWEFKYENYNLYEISYSGLLVEYNYLFENKKTNKLQHFKDLYYYDLDEVLPVLLKEETTLIDGESYTVLKTNKLWEKDIDGL